MDLATASLDDLYRELGKEVPAGLEFSEDGLERGKQAFEKVFSKVTDQICSNDTVRVLVQDRKDAVADQITLGALLATQFTGVVGATLNVTCLVAITARLGIKTLCAKQWTSLQQPGVDA